MPMKSDTVENPLPPTLAAQPISRDVLMEKYARNDEHCIDDIHRRVARALAQAEKPENREAWASRFLQALRDGFVPAGRIPSAAGTRLVATLINCFVQPVGDSITGDDEGYPGIYVALAEAAETMRRGGGVGYDFSRIRPRGAWVAGTQSSASGPVPFMRVFDCSCQTVESVGARRGAQMGVLRCDHPDIEDFIGAKDHGELTNFNLSVGLTDAFMQAVCDDRTVELVHRAEPGPRIRTDARHRRDDGLWVYGTRRARALWERIMRSAYVQAEPGALFLDRVNADNNLSCCETLAATNPCGEQPLPPYGGCCLGSIDLTRFVKNPFEPAARFDEEGFSRLATLAVRMLDNVLDITAWPLERQRQEALGKRRIGLGFTGLGDALVMLNLRYDAPEGRDAARRIARALRDAAYAASCELARERGAFPLFNADPYLSRNTFASRLPEPLKMRIRAQHAQLAPAVDCAYRNHQSCLFGQREQRRRAGLRLDFHATQAPARGRGGGVRGRGPCAKAVPPAQGSAGGARACLRHGAADERARARGDGGGRGAVHRCRHLEDGQRARRLSVRRLQGPVHAGLAARAEGPDHLSSQRLAGGGAGSSPAPGMQRLCGSGCVGMKLLTP